MSNSKQLSGDPRGGPGRMKIKNRIKLLAEVNNLIDQLKTETVNDFHWYSCRYPEGTIARRIIVDIVIGDEESSGRRGQD